MFFKNRAFWNIMRKYCRAGYVTDDNMTLPHCMLDY